MFKTINRISVFVIGGICTAAITACSPTYQTSAYGQGAYGQSVYGQGGTGFEHAQYGYDYVSDQSAYGYNQGIYDYGAAQGFNAGFSAPYGNAFSGGAALRGSCGFTPQNCGMMAVVPVYPVYQVITPIAAAPEVQQVEVPTITIAEPEPVTIEIFDQEPVFESEYEPVTDFWPEPETPVQSWKPIRK